MRQARVAPLREDLRLYESGSDRDGAPMWAIQDPVTNRFYRIGWLEYECLLRWPGDPAQIAADIASTTPLAVDVALHPEKLVRANVGVSKPGTDGDKPSFV